MMMHRSSNGSTVLTQRRSPNGGNSVTVMGDPKMYPVGSAAWRRALQQQKAESEQHLATAGAVGAVAALQVKHGSSAPTIQARAMARAAKAAAMGEQSFQ